MENQQKMNENAALAGLRKLKETAEFTRMENEEYARTRNEKSEGHDLLKELILRVMNSDVQHELKMRIINNLSK